MNYPKCFTNEGQYQKWAEMLNSNKHDYKLAGVPDYCYDCTKEYREEMTEDGRCKCSDKAFRWAMTSGKVDRNYKTPKCVVDMMKKHGGKSYKISDNVVNAGKVREVR